MNKIKMTVAALVIAAGSLGAFAFTKAEAKTEKAPVTYWVTAKVGTNYVVSDNPADEQDCPGGSEPCKISTTEAPDSSHQLSSAQMFGANTSIIERRNDL